MNKKNNFLIENYNLSWKYLKESRKFIYFGFLIFLFFSLIGFFISISPSLSEKLFELIKEVLEKISVMDKKELVFYIFLNNFQSSFLSMVFGIFFGVFPALALIFNGYLLGFVASNTVNSEGIFVLWRLLPHGIFELPAIFISLGLGLKLGTFIFKKNIKKTFKNYFLNSLRIFLFVVVPLLILAAVIEGILIFYLR